MGIRGLKQLWKKHRVLVSAFALASVVTLVFAVRFTVGVIYWSTHREEPIRPWMTIGYVGHSWGLNPRAIDAEAGFAPPEGKPLTLTEIAAAKGVPVAEIIRQVEDVVARLKAEEAEGKDRPK